MKLKVPVLALVMIFIMCSCATPKDTHSATQSITASSDTSYPEVKPYTDYFSYTSIDEFVSKIEENGIEEFCRCAEYGDTVPQYRAVERHEAINETIDNCVWEVYYKGERTELQEIVGFRVAIEDAIYPYQSCDRYCEYFFKYSDPQFGDCVSFVRFSKVDRDIFSEKTEGGFALGLDYLTPIEIPLGDEQMKCAITGDYDFNTGEWGGRKIYFNLNDEVMVYFNFVPIDEIEEYALRVKLEQYPTSYGVEEKLKEEFILNYLPYNCDYFLEHFFEYFSFKKVEIDSAL